MVSADSPGLTYVKQQMEEPPKCSPRSEKADQDQSTSSSPAVITKCSMRSEKQRLTHQRPLNSAPHNALDTKLDDVVPSNFESHQKSIARNTDPTPTDDLAGVSSPFQMQENHFTQPVPPSSAKGSPRPLAPFPEPSSSPRSSPPPTAGLRTPHKSLAQFPRSAPDSKPPIELSLSPPPPGPPPKIPPCALRADEGAGIEPRAPPSEAPTAAVVAAAAAAAAAARGVRRFAETPHAPSEALVADGVRISAQLGLSWISPASGAGRAGRDRQAAGASRLGCPRSGPRQAPLSGGGVPGRGRAGAMGGLEIERRLMDADGPGGEAAGRIAGAPAAGVPDWSDGSEMESAESSDSGAGPGGSGSEAAAEECGGAAASDTQAALQRRCRRLALRERGLRTENSRLRRLLLECEVLLQRVAATGTLEPLPGPGPGPLQRRDGGAAVAARAAAASSPAEAGQDPGRAGSMSPGPAGRFGRRSGSESPGRSAAAGRAAATAAARFFAGLCQLSAGHGGGGRQSRCPAGATDSELHRDRCDGPGRAASDPVSGPEPLRRSRHGVSAGPGPAAPSAAAAETDDSEPMAPAPAWTDYDSESERLRTAGRVLQKASDVLAAAEAAASQSQGSRTRAGGLGP